MLIVEVQPAAASAPAVIPMRSTWSQILAGVMEAEGAEEPGEDMPTVHSSDSGSAEAEGAMQTDLEE